MENCVLNWDLTIKTCGFSWMKKKWKHKKTLDVRVIYSNWFYHEQLRFDHQTWRHPAGKNEIKPLLVTELCDAWSTSQNIHTLQLSLPFCAFGSMAGQPPVEQCSEIGSCNPCSAFFFWLVHHPWSPPAILIRTRCWCFWLSRQLLVSTLPGKLSSLPAMLPCMKLTRLSFHNLESDSPTSSNLQRLRGKLLFME